eukprot:gene348-981_t
MADVEFEPLHGENEDDGEEFMLERKKKDSSAKKYKQKGPLFQRKSVEKKEKGLVIDNSKAFTVTPTRPQGHHHFHHHQSRQVEGHVGPGDIEFGSSPPSNDDILQNNPQCTGCMTQSNASNSTQQPAWQTPMQLPLRAQHQQWTKVQDQQPLKKMSQSQEKLTLLEKAKMKATGTPSQNSNMHESSFPPPEKSDTTTARSVFPPQISSYNTPSAPVTTPPRVASPVDKGPFAQNPQPVSSPMEKPGRFGRSDSWDPNTRREHNHNEDNWADFSKSFDSSEFLEEEIRAKRRQSQVSTISEGSEASYVSEIEENDWRITDEQRNYYITQFKKLQPNENAVIKGPQARDFFLKSNLPVEVLSRVWHLSDLNKDSALDLEEFCIAMHLVVAVKHDVELPSALPSTLLPSSQGMHRKRQQQQQQQLYDDVTSADDERPQSPQQTHSNRNEHQWARFEFEEKRDKQESSALEEKNDEAQVIASRDDAIEEPVTHVAESGSDSIAVQRQQVSDSNTQQQGFQSPQVAASMSRVITESPVVKDSLSKKSSIGIARPRGMGATINLIDALPGQLLPPPDNKKPRKVMQVPQSTNFSQQGLPSPPTSPTARFSSDFSNQYHDKRGPADTSKQNEIGQTIKEIRTGSPTQDVDPPDGFQPPLPAPRSPDHMATPLATEAELAVKEASPTAESPSVLLRRSSSAKRGGRPRSYTADSRSSRESLVDIFPPPKDSKDIEVPPTPPPRKVRTHKRGSSLDLSKLFSSKSQQRPDGNVDNSRLEALPPRLPFNDKKEDKKQDMHIIIPRPRPAPLQHNRSTSCDSGQVIAPPPKTPEGIMKDPRIPGYRKKPAPPKPSSATRTDRSRSLERDVDTSHQIRELAEPDHKPIKLRGPLRKKRQRQEIQASIRILREKNACISNLNSELQQEIKELIGARGVWHFRLSRIFFTKFGSIARCLQCITCAIAQLSWMEDRWIKMSETSSKVWSEKKAMLERKYKKKHKDRIKHCTALVFLVAVKKKALFKESALKEE